MKLATLIIAWIVLPIMFSYLAAAFTFLSVNPSDWTQGARLAVSLSVLFLGLPFGLIACGPGNNE